MLSVKPGNVKAGNDVVDPTAVATASVVLSTAVTVLPVWLYTKVYFRLGETAISPGWELSPAKVTTEVESTSSSTAAFTMFSTGRLAPVTPVVVPGNSGFEMKTRNAKPLGLCVVAEEPLLPQEIMTLAATSTSMLTKILFNLGLRRA